MAGVIMLVPLEDQKQANCKFDQDVLLMRTLASVTIIYDKAVAQKTGIPKWNPGKWKHGPTPAVCPSCLILSHTHKDKKQLGAHCGPCQGGLPDTSSATQLPTSVQPPNRRDPPKRTRTDIRDPLCRESAP